MKKKLLLLNIVLGFSLFLNAQNAINLHSVTNARQPFGDTGYTLDGTQMVGSRQKLLNQNYFGTSGIYPKTITITDGYLSSGSLENITTTTGVDMFYFGIFNSSNTSLIPFTSAELDSLHEWSVRGGKLIIGSGSPVPSIPFIPNILNSRWGFDLALLFPTPVLPTTAGTNSSLFSGAFGNVFSANQGGGSQGYFNLYPNDIVVLADDGAGHPTMYLDCATLDLVVADGDIYTGLGNISFGNSITTDNDALWANTIQYMDELEGPPVVNQNGNQLSTGNYSSYQWFLNGNMIPGATTNTLTATQPGSYSVQVALSCGCNSVASQSVTFVGMEELGVKPSISISPNPAGSHGITFSGVTKQLNISVFSVEGKLVDNLIINSQQLHYDTGHLGKGVYFLKMIEQNDDAVSVLKLIIE